MTEGNVAKGYFDAAMREGAPSAKLKEKKDFVKGTIIDLFEAPMTKFGTNDPIVEDDGTHRHQLVIILQTASRNWSKVAKTPSDSDGSPKDPSLDDGKRAVYVPRFTNIYAALGKALKAAGASDPEIGGEFGIVVEDLQDTGKGNPLKVFRAKYDPPAPSADEPDDEEDPLGDIGGDQQDEAPAEKPAAKSKVQDKPKAKKEEPAAEAEEVEEPPF